MKLTKEQAHLTIATLSVIPYFPSDPMAQLIVINYLEKFVSGQTELDWLLECAINAMDAWHGLSELRGLYCTRFKPEDGIEHHCRLPGYTPADNEARSVAALPAASEMGLLEAPRVTDNEAEQALASLSDKPIPFKRLPVPTKADREYSRKLLEGVLNQ